MTDFEVVYTNGVLTRYFGDGARYEMNPQSRVLTSFDGDGRRVSSPSFSSPVWVAERSRRGPGQRLRDARNEVHLTLGTRPLGTANRIGVKKFDGRPSSPEVPTRSAFRPLSDRVRRLRV